VIIGVPQSFVFENKPDNVICFPPVKNEELISHYNRATYYLQLSMAEGFPNALCEAMLCGCVPIVSDVASMPEIVSDSGFVLKKKSKSLLSELIKNVIDSDVKQLSLLARKRIEENYTEENRKEKLLKLIAELIKK
jgi:glycosyltransferase involved in cell wall biosynthesis